LDKIIKVEITNIDDEGNEGLSIQIKGPALDEMDLISKACVELVYHLKNDEISNKEENRNFTVKE
jgi:hypothetical protein